MNETRKRNARAAIARRVQKHRQAVRAAGLRPIRVWAPDVRSKSFVVQARRQALAIAESKQDQEDLAFIESIAEWDPR